MAQNFRDILRKEKMRHETSFYRIEDAPSITSIPTVERIDGTAIIMRDIEALTALLAKNYSYYNQTTIDKINESICELSDVLVKVSKTPSVLYQVGL